MNHIPKEYDSYSRQLLLELYSVEEAQTRLTNATVKAEQKTYASSTIYGRHLIKTNVQDLAEFLKEKMNGLRRGLASVDAEAVYSKLKDSDLEVVALIGLKVLLDCLGKHRQPRLVTVQENIAKAVETEMKLNFYKSQDKELFKDITKFFKHTTGSRQKATVFTYKFNQKGMTWKNWSGSDRHKVGGWVVNAIASVLGWVRIELIRHPTCKTKTINVLTYSPEFLLYKEAVLDQAMEKAHLLLPMVHPPNNWSVTERGGLLTESIRQNHPLVRTYFPPLKQGVTPIEMLNNLQHQRYTLNPAVYQVALDAFNSYRTIGKFCRETAKPFPPSPGDNPTEEVLRQYKREAREIAEYNAGLEQKNWRTTETMYLAGLYMDEDVLYLPWSFDYRGRVYPQTSTLNPQGTDFDKSLLYFKDEGPVNEWWLAFHCATTFGNDKWSMDERVNWTRDNISLITRVATDPLGNQSDWEDVEEPWCFLASCLEYYNCCVLKVKETSGLPVGIDATCSGLQHLSAMTMDGEAASQVNVTPTDKPADGYKTVAEASLKYIEDEEVHQYLNRKVTKRTVMCVPYGITQDSARKHIRSALKDQGVDLSKPGRLTETVSAIYKKAVPEVFNGPVNVMNWLQGCAKELMTTNKEINWVTPSGFHVRQCLKKSVSKRISTNILGSLVTSHVGVGFGEPDIQAHKGALPPNLVHSLDASLLHLTFAKYDKPFTVIHDCVMGRSCDMEGMSYKLRENFIRMYKSYPLKDWASQVGVTIPDGLVKDNLDIDSVIHSQYFFC